MLRQLFTIFLKIGAFTIGGGYAMIPLIEAEVVDKKRWISKDDFLDLMAIAQSAPGVFAVNMAIFIGYRLKGLKGCISASLGAILPSFSIILVIASFFHQIKDLQLVEQLFMGIRPAVVALIAVPTFSMAKAAKINRYTIWIAILSALLIWQVGLSPIWVIIIAGIGGYLYGRRHREASSDRPTTTHTQQHKMMGLKKLGLLVAIAAIIFGLSLAIGSDSATKIWSNLFSCFFNIGLFGFGGGYAMLSMIQGEVVANYHWITSQEFTDIVAISQMTPGPIGINSATYVGYTTINDLFGNPYLGILGSLTSTMAVVLPSFILMIIISKYFLRYQKHPMVMAIFMGLRPAVVGLIAAAALCLMNSENFGMPGVDNYHFICSCIIFVLVFVATRKYRISPINLIIACGIAGLLLY